MYAAVACASRTLVAPAHLHLKTIFYHVRLRRTGERTDNRSHRNATTCHGGAKMVQLFDLRCLNHRYKGVLLGTSIFWFSASCLACFRNAPTIQLKQRSYAQFGCPALFVSR